MSCLNFLFVVGLVFTSHHAVAQRSHFEKYNLFINENAQKLKKAIQLEGTNKKTEQIRKGQDSVRLILRNKSHDETFTFFIVNDTVRYIGVTFFETSPDQLEKILSSKFERTSLLDLKGGIFENYTNSIHIARALFLDKQSKMCYLSVTYPELSNEYSNIVMWLKK